MQFKNGTDKLHVSRKAIEKYGPTEGCPACSSTIRKRITTGRVGVHHNDACRTRVTKEMKKDPQYRQLMHKHQIHVDTIQRAEDNVPGSESKIRLEEQRGHIRKAIHAIQQEMKVRINNITTQLDQTMMESMLANRTSLSFTVRQESWRWQNVWD